MTFCQYIPLSVLNFDSFLVKQGCCSVVYIQFFFEKPLSCTLEKTTTRLILLNIFSLIWLYHSGIVVFHLQSYTCIWTRFPIKCLITFTTTKRLFLRRRKHLQVFFLFYMYVNGNCWYPKQNYNCAEQKS